MLIPAVPEMWEGILLPVDWLVITSEEYSTVVNLHYLLERLTATAEKRRKTRLRKRSAGQKDSSMCPRGFGECREEILLIRNGSEMAVWPGNGTELWVISDDAVLIKFPCGGNRIFKGRGKRKHNQSTTARHAGQREPHLNWIKWLFFVSYNITLKKTG